MVETALKKRAAVPPPVSSPKVRSITEAASRKRAAAGTGKQEVDKVIWPLLDTGLSVRTIATQTTISAGTVGRSRKRWIATQGVSAADIETPEHAETAESVI
jgi:DNA-binding NarL/FixJ family response regulator